MNITTKMIVLSLLLGAGCSNQVATDNFEISEVEQENQPEMVQEVEARETNSTVANNNSTVVQNNSNAGQEIDPETVNIPTPQGFSLLGDTFGIINDYYVKAMVYDTNINSDFGTQRQLYVYQWVDNQWQLWGQSNTAILPSQGGGTFGDPFRDVRVEGNGIVVDHFGGSRQKWNYTHIYINQNNEWKLSEARINYGADCDYTDNLYFGLDSGYVNHMREFQQCDSNGTIDNTEVVSETEYFLDSVPRMSLMANFIPGENEITIRDTNAVLFY